MNDFWQLLKKVCNKIVRSIIAQRKLKHTTGGIVLPDKKVRNLTHDVIKIYGMTFIDIDHINLI